MRRTPDPMARRVLARALAATARRLPPEQVAATAGKAFDALIQVAEDTHKAAKGERLFEYYFWREIEWECVAAARLLPPREAVDTLLRAVAGTSGIEWLALPRELEAAAGQLPPDQAVDALLKAVAAARPTDPALPGLVRGLAAAAGRLPPDQAAAACRPAVDALLNSIKMSGKDIRSYSSYSHDHIEALESVSLRLPPGEAATTLCHAAATFMSSFLSTRVPDKILHLHCRNLSDKLIVLADRLPADQATQVRYTAAVLVLSSTALTPLDPDEGASNVYSAFSAIVLGAGGRLWSRDGKWVFSDFTRELATTIGLGTEPGQLMIALPRQLPRAVTLNPLPSRTLINLLKHPLCVGTARDAVLVGLELTYNRAFPDYWEFVRYARDNGLGLDLTSPPDRTAWESGS